MAKAKPAAWWFYGNERFFLTVIGLALSASGFVVGGEFSDPTSVQLRNGVDPQYRIFRFLRSNPHSSPFHSEKFHPVFDDNGQLICVIRVRSHDDGKLSLLGVRIDQQQVNPRLWAETPEDSGP